jgi:aspartate dehydrogenase
MKIGIMGCGAIGSSVARAASKFHEVEKIRLLDRDDELAKTIAREIWSEHCPHDHFSDFLRGLDLVIEAASQDAVVRYGKQVLEAGCDLMVLSVGALAEKRLYDDMRAMARAKGARIYVPSGAMAGMDGVHAAAQAELDEVILTSSKPPEGFKGALYLSQKGLKIDGLKEPLLLFEGPASEAVKAFPKNVNVAATLSLCGLGPQRTKVRIIADPALKRNKHEVMAKGSFGELRIEVQNVPSPQNARTSYLAALSAIGCLKRISSGVWIGV